MNLLASRQRHSAVSLERVPPPPPLKIDISSFRRSAADLSWTTSPLSSFTAGKNFLSGRMSEENVQHAGFSRVMLHFIATQFALKAVQSAQRLLGSFVFLPPSRLQIITGHHNLQ